MIVVGGVGGNGARAVRATSTRGRPRWDHETWTSSFWQGPARSCWWWWGRRRLLVVWEWETSWPNHCPAKHAATPLDSPALSRRLITLPYFRCEGAFPLRAQQTTNRWHPVRNPWWPPSSCMTSSGVRPSSRCAWGFRRSSPPSGTLDPYRGSKTNFVQPCLRVKRAMLVQVVSIYGGYFLPVDALLLSIDHMMFWNRTSDPEM